MNAILTSTLQKLRRNVKHLQVFLSDNGKPMADVNNVSKLFRRACRLAGLEPATYGLEVRSPREKNYKLLFFQFFLILSSACTLSNHAFFTQSYLLSHLRG